MLVLFILLDEILRATSPLYLAPNLDNLRLKRPSRFFELLNLFHQPTDFRILENPLRRLSPFAQIHRSLADIAMELAQLLIELADCKPDS